MSYRGNTIFFKQHEIGLGPRDNIDKGRLICIPFAKIVMYSIILEKKYQM